MEEAKILHQKIKLANKKRAEKVKAWARFVGYYDKGDYTKEKIVDEDRVVVETIYAYVRALIPGLYYKNPYIYIKAKNKESIVNAQSAEYAMNQEWNKGYLKRTIKRGILDNLLVGHTWVKTEYMAHTKAEMLAMGQLHRFLRPKKIYTIRVPYLNMFVDTEAPNADNMRWLAQMFYRTPDEIKADNKFNNVEIPLDKMVSIVPKDNIEINRQEKDFLRVEMFEFWDRQTQKYQIIATGSDDILFESEFPQSDTPFTNLTIEESSSDFFGISPVSKIESEAKELNETRSQMLNHRKRMKSIILYDPEEINSEEIENIKNSNDMSLIPVKGLVQKREAGGNPFVEFETPNINPDFYKVDDIIKGSMREIIAMPEFGMAQPVKGVRTAYEASLIQNALRLRTDDKMDAISDFCTEIVLKSLELMKKHYKKYEVIYTGREGQRLFETMTKEDFKGDFVVDINVADSIPEDVVVRRDQAMRFFEMFAEHDNYDDVYLAQDVFNAFGRKDFDRAYRPEGKAGAPGTVPIGYGVAGAAGRRGQPGVAAGGSEGLRRTITAAQGALKGGDVK